MQHRHITSTSGFLLTSPSSWAHLTEFMPNMTNTSASCLNLSKHRWNKSSRSAVLASQTKFTTLSTSWMPYPDTLQSPGPKDNLIWSHLASQLLDSSLLHTTQLKFQSWKAKFWQMKRNWMIWLTSQISTSSISQNWMTFRTNLQQCSKSTRSTFQKSQIWWNKNSLLLSRSLNNSSTLLTATNFQLEPSTMKPCL